MIYSVGENSNQGVKVWPNGFDETFCTDHWRCRYSSTDGIQVLKEDSIEILQKAVFSDLDIIKTETCMRSMVCAAIRLARVSE